VRLPRTITSRIDGDGRWLWIFRASGENILPPEQDGSHRWAPPKKRPTGDWDSVISFHEYPRGSVRPVVPAERKRRRTVRSQHSFIQPAMATLSVAISYSRFSCIGSCGGIAQTISNQCCPRSDNGIHSSVGPGNAQSVNWLATLYPNMRRTTRARLRNAGSYQTYGTRIPSNPPLAVQEYQAARPSAVYGNLLPSTLGSRV